MRKFAHAFTHAQGGIFPLITSMCFVLVLSTGANAQVRDTVMGEVNIEGKKKEKVSEDDKVNTFSPGQKVSHVDSVVLQQYKFQTMANLLSQQTSAFVKSYGFNGMATLNFRGSSAAQSMVLWNGVPLQSAALGMTDISTLPVNVIDKVNIVYGSSSALWGSGNVGGALMLENDLPSFDSNGRKDAVLSLATGSYRQYSGGGKIAFSGRKWSISANGFVQSAKNDLRYTDSKGVSRKMTNSDLYSLGVMMNAAYLINEKSSLSISGWYQRFDREVPPALFESSSAKSRQDVASRLMLHYKKRSGPVNLYLKSSIVEDKLYYDDMALGLRTANTSYQSYSEWGVRRNYGRHSLLVFVPFNFLWMKDSAYSQSRTGISGAFAMHFWEDKLHVSLQASEQFIDNKDIFLPGINASIELAKWLEIKINGQRTYRAPNLTELYFNPGGNRALLPERGWAAEGGYYVSTNKNKRLALSQSSSAFYRDVKDWIIWYGGSIWTPHNIARVRSRGVETENMLKWKQKRVTIHLGLNTAYVIATTVESHIPGDGSIGKQIPYAPRYNGQLNAGFSYKGLYFNYNHGYTGYRFYTTDESAWIEPYSTANVQLSYMLMISSKASLMLSAQCNNLYNRQYQVVAQRPMPGTNWLVGVRLHFAE